MQMKFDSNDNLVVTIYSKEIDENGMRPAVNEIESGCVSSMQDFANTLLGVYAQISKKEIIPKSYDIRLSEIDGILRVSLTCDIKNYFNEPKYKTANISFPSVARLFNEIKNIKNKDGNLEYVSTEEEYLYCYNVYANSALDFEALSKRLSMTNEVAEIPVYQDERDGRFVIMIEATSSLLPGAFYEYCNVEEANEVIFGSTEHLRQITTIGELAKI